MVSMRRVSFICLVGLAFVGAYAEEQKNTKNDPLYFVDVNLEDFVNRIVAQENRAEFKQYYVNLIKQTDSMNDTDKRKVKAIYYDKALAGLKSNRPDWDKVLKMYYANPLVTLDTSLNNVRVLVSQFLVRYGAYEDYCTRKALRVAQNTPGVWGTIKSYVASVGNTVAGWFGYGKQEPQKVTA